MSASVRVRSEILAQLREEAAKTPAEECCGLLAGSGEIISVIFPACNAHANRASAYEIAPQELFQFVRKIRARGLQLLGIYHSHPRGENFPSRSDVAQAFYPETPYFIVSLLPNAPQSVRAFLIRDGQVTDLEIETV